MSDVLPGLIVLATGGSMAPPLLLLTILFLDSRRPIPSATALALGYFTTCAVMGIAGLTLYGGAEDAVSLVGRVISVSVSGLLVVIGLRSLLHAPDPDAQPPRWMESISSMSPARAFGFGMALFPIQIKNLAILVACLNLIAAAELSLRGSAVALGLVLLIFAVPVLTLIGLYAATPDRASNMLGSLREWIEGNTAPSRSCSASRSEGSSSSEVSQGESLGSRWRSAMGAFTELLSLTFVGVVASPVSLCLSLLSRIHAKTAGREPFRSNFPGSGISHIPGTCCG
jgi:hypothetical protein